MINAESWISDGTKAQMCEMREREPELYIVV